MLTENSKLFNHSVEKRLLIVHDELPAEAQTPYDTIVAARRENAALRARITELEAEIGANVDPKAKKALVDAQEEIEALRGSKEATDKAYAALEALVAAIDPEVIAKARESVAATQF
jgi:predicted  nucleic acid-binding Zn-ribbon protein